MPKLRRKIILKWILKVSDMDYLNLALISLFGWLL
jgi:hypothetical protein